MPALEPKWTLAHKFCTDFNATASELVSRLDALKSTPDFPAAVQVAASDLSRLAKSLSDATGSLPSYDQRQCELQLKSLERCIEELRATSVTAPKFSFKRKPTQPKPSADHALAPESPLTETQSTLTKPSEALAGLSHRYLTVLDVHSPNSSGGVSISDLDSCIVNLLPHDKDQREVTALHVQGVSGCVILLPQISGSIILHDLSNCVVAIGCHQFRMHDSTAVDVYLQSASDPIIEHCSGVRFAAYPSGLVHGESLQGSKQLSVKDFSHILPTPSPNWSFLLEERWETTWPVLALKDQALREELGRILPGHSQLAVNGQRS